MRLEINRKTDLAIRVMTELAAAGVKVKGARLAATAGTTTAFLAQVMTPLVRNEWVHSEPGRNGGYELIVDTEDVSVLDVIEAVEGPTDTDECVLRRGTCSLTEQCAAHAAWSTARAALLSTLATTPLARIEETVA